MSELLNNLTAAKSKHADLLKQHDALLEKQQITNTEINKSQLEFNQDQAHLIECERRHILDQATDTELEAAQSKVDDLKQRLNTFARRLEVIEEALVENTAAINKSLQNLQIARSAFCLSERDRIFSELRDDPKIKEKLLKAFGAYASNGHVQWITNFKIFTQNLFEQPSQAEMDQAIEKYQKDNHLD